MKKYKVNGREVDVSSDKIDTLVSLGLASTEKFNEAKKYREEADSILGLAKNEKSALKVLEKAGFSRAEALAIVEEELKKEYEEMELSPEEKSKRAEKAEFEQLRKEKAEREQKIKEEAESKEEEAYLSKIDEEIAEAIKFSDLPQEPILGKWAIQYMSAYAQQGEDLSAKDAMKLVSGDMKEVMRAMLSGMDASEVKQFLKEDHIKGLQNEVLKAFQDKQAPFSKPAQAPKQVNAKPGQDANEVASQVIKGRDFWAKKKGW
jgi:hypothetical protein